MAKQNNPFSDIFSQNFSNNDFTKLFEGFQTGSFDTKAFMQTQQKNIQAISAAQAAAFEGIQTIAQRQSEILSRLVEDNSSLAKEALSEGTPEEKIAKNADLFKTSYERSIESLKEISELISKSNQDATTILNKRVSDSMNEIKDAVKTDTKGKKAA